MQEIANGVALSFTAFLQELIREDYPASFIVLVLSTFGFITSVTVYIYQSKRNGKTIDTLIKQIERVIHELK